MIILNDYKDKKVWIRYFFQKIVPKFLYPCLLKFFYKRYLHRSLSLSNPTRLSEKINILKLSENIELKFLLSDRLYSKRYVQTNLPELSTAIVYQSATSFDTLDFDKLPKSFILKTNHACKTGILINDKNNITKEELDSYRKYYKKILNINYAFWGVLELQYKNIKPLIYAEEYLKPSFCEKFKEYEVYCINGEPEFIQYTINNENSFDVSYLNNKFERADFDLFYQRKNIFIPDTTNREKIINNAKKIAKHFKFARVDFFEMNNTLYFAEVTFAPFMGNLQFVPDDFDLILGEKLKIW